MTSQEQGRIEEESIENGGSNLVSKTDLTNIRREIEMLDNLKTSKEELINDINFGISYKVDEIKEKRQSVKDNNPFSIMNMSNRGLSWNIAFLDSLIRKEFYLENAITYKTIKSLSNGIDLNIRSDEKDISRTIELVEELETKHRKALYDFVSLGVSHGGSGALIVVDNVNKEEMKTPLTVDKLKKGDNIYLRPLTRLYQVQPDFTYQGKDKFISEIGKDVGIYDSTELGKPQYYRVSISGDMFKKDGDNYSFDKIHDTFIVHRSRLLIFNGSELSWIERQIEQYFGRSIIEKSIDEIKNYKKALEEMMKLLYRSNIPVINIEGLSNVSRSGNLGIQKIEQVIESYYYALDAGDLIVIGDKDKEELKFIQAEFRHLAEQLLDRKKELSAALKVPLSVAFNTKEEIEENEFFYEIEYIQERQIRPALNQLLPLIYKSKYGEDIPEYSFDFKSLEYRTEKEKAETIKIASDIIMSLFDKNIITVDIAHNMLISSSENISDMLFELDKQFRDKFPHSDKTINDFQIELSKALNWNDNRNELKNGSNKEYNMAETKLKGNIEGGSQLNRKPKIDIGNIGNKDNN